MKYHLEQQAEIIASWGPKQWPQKLQVKWCDRTAQDDFSTGQACVYTRLMSGTSSWLESTFKITNH